jgi:hypothetical protein
VSGEERVKAASTKKSARHWAGRVTVIEMLVTVLGVLVEETKKQVTNARASSTPRRMGRGLVRAAMVDWAAMVRV